MVCAKIILACLSLAVLVNGQVLKIGNCPDYKIAENFNPAKVGGIFYCAVFFALFIVLYLYYCVCNYKL